MGMYLIEGENLLEEAVKNGVAPEAVLVRNEGVSVSAGEKIKSALKKSDIADRFFLIDGRMLDEVSETETSQGIIAAVRKPVFGADDYLDEANHGNIVVLDRLQDPGNIGTIIRTADAAGYSLVVALKGTADIFYSGKQRLPPPRGENSVRWRDFSHIPGRQPPGPPEYPAPETGCGNGQGGSAPG